MSYKAKMVEELSHSLGMPVRSTALIDEEPVGSGEKTTPLSPPLPPADPEESLRPNSVHEERMKWQVEVANVRRELESKLEKERQVWEEERGALRKEIVRLEKELGSAPQLVGKLQAKLEMAEERCVHGVRYWGGGKYRGRGN